jgi:hypothetical protein
MTIELKIKWEALSWVEYSSGIEVLYLAKFFRDRKGTHKGIIRHALDEYRHAGYFRDFAKEFSSLSKLSVNINLTEVGGLKNSKFPICPSQLVDICTYLKVGEQRAWKSNEKLIDMCGNKKVLDALKIIQNDEANHESSLDLYLKKFPIKSYLFYLKHKIVFFFMDIQSSGIVCKVRDATDGRLVQLLFKLLPKKSLILTTNDDCLGKLIATKRSAV